LTHPELSALDSEVIKLTAQYTAISGRKFLAGLATREQRNPQFDFLKPTHALFGYFTQLVDSYDKVLKISSQRKTKLEDALKPNGDGRANVLDRCVHRLEWVRMEKEKKEAEQAELDAERSSYLAVDWHEFVIVEVIEFEEGDDEELPPR
jgi:splicing factor 3A subunit 1